MRPKTIVLMVVLLLGALVAMGLDGPRSEAETTPTVPQMGPDWAVVTATVDPQGTNIICSFEYESDAAFTRDGSAFGSPASVACEPEPTGGRSQTVSARITGLTPLTTYHYRVVVTDEGGSADGPDALFTTLPLPPVVTTAAATEVTASSVMLNGTLNPNGSAVTDCHFDYGPTNAYGRQAPCDQAPGSGNAPVPVSTTVPWTAGSPLHYRLVATTGGGTAAGEDVVALVIVDHFPPTITDSRVQTISRPTATGAATVNPNGSPSECWFVDTVDGARIPCAPQPGSGASPVAVTGGIPVHGAIIAFRVVASNAGGTTYGPEIRAPVIIVDGPEMLVIPPQPGTLRIAAIGMPRRGRIAVSVTCDEAPRDFCRGRLTLTARVRLHGRRRVVVLGRAPYDLTAGQRSATFAVRLSPRGRRLLRRHPRLRVAAHATPAATP